MKIIKRYLSINNTVWLILFFVPYFVRTEKINHTLDKANEIFIQPYSTFLALILLAAFFINTEYSRKLSIVKWFAPIAFWSILGLQNNGNWHILASQIASITIFLAFLLTIIFHETLIEYFQTPSVTNENKGLISGDPIEEDNENDSFGRKKYAESIVAEIRKTINKRAFNIAITGAWGSGKTSFLNLIKGDMQNHEKYKNKFITVKYNPWDFKEDKIIGLDLLKSISHELGNEKELQEKFKGLMVSLQGVDQSPWYKVIPNLLIGFTTEKSINDYREEIGKALQDQDKKLVIFLDDLDRLDGDEILEVFKTIRNSFDIANTFFILGFDIEYVADQIKEKVKGERALEYLDKIFQMRLFMPSNADFDYYDEYKQLVKSHFNFELEADIDWTFPIKSKRKLKQLLNSIKVLVSKNNSGDFDFSALLYIEYIKIKYPYFYDYIINNMDSVFQWYKSQNSIASYNENMEETKNSWEFFKEVQIKKEGKEAFLLLQYFLNKLDKSDDFTIKWEEYYKYFKYSLHDEEFPESLINTIIGNEDKELITKTLNAKNKNSFFSKIDERIQSNSKDNESWLKTIFIEFLFNNHDIFLRYKENYGLNDYNFYSSIDNLKDKIKNFHEDKKLELLVMMDKKNKESFEYLLELFSENFSDSIDIIFWNVYYNLKEFTLDNKKDFITQFKDITKETISLNYFNLIQKFISDEPSEENIYKSISNILEDYCKMVGSSSLFAVFKRSEIEFDGKVITFKVSDEISMDFIVEEKDLNEYFKNKLNDKDITISVIANHERNKNYYYLTGLFSAQDWLDCIPIEKINELPFIEISDWLKSILEHERSELNYNEIFGYEFSERHSKTAKF